MKRGSTMLSLISILALGSLAPAPTLRHMFYPGKAFSANPSQNIGFQEGCVEVADIDTLFTPVFLPESSVVKYLTMYYGNSTVPANLTVSLVAHEIGLGWPTHTTIAAVNGTIPDGFEAVTSSEISHTVDMSSTTYTIEIAQPYDMDRTTVVCGVRIDYIPPSIFAIALPTIIR